jgi:hypothetical protein
VDDTRIRELAEEVMRELRAPSASATPGPRSDLEARVAALESEVARLRQQRALPMASDTPAVHVHVEAGPPHEHPSHGRLGPGGAAEGRCVLEPDKPCVQSGQCRSYGH